MALVDVDRLRLRIASSDSSALVRCKRVSARTFRGSIRRHSNDRGKYDTKRRVNIRELVGSSGSKKSVLIEGSSQKCS